MPITPALGDWGRKIIMSSKPTCATQRVQDWLEVHGEALSQQTKRIKQQKKTMTMYMCILIFTKIEAVWGSYQDCNIFSQKEKQKNYKLPKLATNNFKDKWFLV